MGVAKKKKIMWKLRYWTHRKLSQSLTVLGRFFSSSLKVWFFTLFSFHLFSSKNCGLDFLLWCNGLRIQCCLCSMLNRCWGVGLIQVWEQWLKDLVLLQVRFDPWTGNLHMPWVQPKKKKNSPNKKKPTVACINTWLYGMYNYQKIIVNIYWGLAVDQTLFWGLHVSYLGFHFSQCLKVRQFITAVKAWTWRLELEFWFESWIHSSLFVWP